MYCQYDNTADADVGIDNVAEYAVGDVLEDVCTKHRADDDTAKAIKIINGDCRSEEAIVGSHACHHHIANQEIGLRHCHVVLLHRLTLDEIQHSGRTLHTKETTHQSAQSACSNLYPFSCRQLDAVAKQHEVDTNQNECYAKDSSQDMVFDACQGKDGDG